MAGDLGGMGNASEIAPKVPFHFQRHPILQKVVPLREKLRGKIPQTLFGILAVGGTSKVHLRIDESIAALPALSLRFVFEEFHQMPALRTFGLKNSP
jgi:hypothetical protein